MAKSLSVRIPENEIPTPLENKSGVVTSRVSPENLEALMALLSSEERKALRYDGADKAAAKATKILQLRGVTFQNGVPVTREAEVEITKPQKNNSIHSVSSTRQVTRTQLSAHLETVLNQHGKAFNQKQEKDAEQILDALSQQNSENVHWDFAQTIMRKIAKLVPKSEKVLHAREEKQPAFAY